MDIREAGIEKVFIMEQFSSKIEDACKTLGIKNPVIVSINTSPLYNSLKPARVKVIGNPGATHMTQIVCDCGCKLNTDGEVFWCSGISCNFYGREETF